MIKRYSFFAKWRNRDVKFFSNLGIEIEEGYYNFVIEEGEKLNQINEHYKTHKNRFLNSKPPEFSFNYVGAKFAIEELDRAESYVLCNNGYPKGYPLPKNNYLDVLNNTYKNVCTTSGFYENQINPFKIASEPKLNKNQVNFSLHWIFDEMFFTKAFFQKVLAPLGLKSREVLIGKNEKVSENIVQLIIPKAQSNIRLENSAFDTNTPCPKCGIKKYSQQILDFMPPFEQDFDFLICQTKESFGETETFQAMRRLIISKEFCNILTRNKVIKYNSSDIFPMHKI